MARKYIPEELIGKRIYDFTVISYKNCGEYFFGCKCGKRVIINMGLVIRGKRQRCRTCCIKERKRLKRMENHHDSE